MLDVITSRATSLPCPAWCVPTALSLASGTPYRKVEETIRRARGCSGPVRDVYFDEWQGAIAALGIAAKCLWVPAISQEGRVCIQDCSGYAVPTEAPTLRQWDRDPNLLYMIRVGGLRDGHALLLYGDYLFDTASRGYPCHFIEHPHGRRHVSAAWVIQEGRP